MVLVEFIKLIIYKDGTFHFLLNLRNNQPKHIFSKMEYKKKRERERLVTMALDKGTDFYSLGTGFVSRGVSNISKRRILIARRNAIRVIPFYNFLHLHCKTKMIHHIKC